MDSHVVLISQVLRNHEHCQYRSHRDSAQRIKYNLRQSRIETERLNMKRIIIEAFKL